MTHLELFEKYDELVNKWEDETSIFSSVSQMIEYDSYKELKSLGPEIVPFIISDFYHDDYHHLIQLIDEFSGEDGIVPERDWGKIGRIANWYVWWGLDKGLLSLTFDEKIAYNVGTDAGKELLKEAMIGPIKYMAENGIDSDMLHMYTALYRGRKTEQEVRKEVEEYIESQNKN